MTETPPPDAPTFELPAPYATADHLASYWRPLTGGEKTRATELLRWAAQLIDEQPGHEDFAPTTAGMVSLDMVKRAMVNGQQGDDDGPSGDGVLETTRSESMADQTASYTTRYINPMGALYLTRAEKDRLARRDARPVGGSIAMQSNAHVPGQPWNRQPNLVSPDAAGDQP